MESHSLEAEISIKVLVEEMKKKMFSAQLQSSLVSPSAFDTAWLAMIPDSKNTENPMFKCCVDWVLNNQQDEGFWGDDRNLIHTLSSTLACILALATWNVGPENIVSGKAYVITNAKKLLDSNHRKLPCWFNIVFPALLEQAERVGLHLNLPHELKALVSSFTVNREKADDKNDLSCAEALLSACDIDELLVEKNLSEGGSLLNSPSASAAAYMVTGHPAVLKYLDSVVQNFPCGVPSLYPVDEELVKLCMVDILLNQGLDEKFTEEIQDTLAQIYRCYNMNSTRDQDDIHLAAEKIYKDALAFRLLRFHGFDVTPDTFCWFLDNKMIMDHLEDNSDRFACTLYSIFRASDLIFPGEYELEDAKSFSRRLLEKSVSVEPDKDTKYISQSFKKMVKKELSTPWIARVDHQDHRMWIENINAPPLRLEKPPFSRLSCLDDDILMQLSVQNYEYRQSIFKNELEELKSWSKQWGLADMGFGREKTTYSYFAVCCTMYSPHHSVIRKLVTKSAILITVADDFYDIMKGSLTELQTLTEAVQRWDGEGLIGPSKIIFDALDYFVRDLVEQLLEHERHDMTNKMQAIWKETFLSWMTESTWGRTGYTPSADEYLDVGMTSIAAHTMVLPSSCFLNQRMPAHKLIHPYYETITKLLMVNARLLNDIQSYQKEQEEGKNNILLLYLKDNPNADIEDSIEYVEKILNVNRMEFLKKVLRNDNDDMPKPCKSLHLACLKVFEMFFNSSNQFDSKTALLEDIKKAIYLPPRFPLPKRTIKPEIKSALVYVQKKKSFSPLITMNIPNSGNTRKLRTINWYGCTNKNMIGQKVLSRTITSRGCGGVHIAPQLTLGFL